MKSNKVKSSAKKNSPKRATAKKVAAKRKPSSNASTRTTAGKMATKKKTSPKKSAKTSSVRQPAKKTRASGAPRKLASATPVRKKLTPPAKRIAEQQSRFPGYPAYKKEDDIMNRGKRTEAELDSRKGSPLIAPKKKKPSTDVESIDDEQEVVSKKGPNDVTREDLLALGDDELESDGGDDEELRNRVSKVDFSGSDLDVPDDGEDSAAEEVGSEDEENKIYSLGGDNHEDLEEDKS